MSRIALNPSDTRSIYVLTVGSGVIQQEIRKPEIFSVNFEKKNLSIRGRNFGSISRILNKQFGQVQLPGSRGRRGDKAQR